MKVEDLGKKKTHDSHHIPPSVQIIEKLCRPKMTIKVATFYLLKLWMFTMWGDEQLTSPKI